MAKDTLSIRFIRKFGLRIRSLRDKRGWTLEDTEEYGWPSWVHMQQIESGKKNVSLITIQKLARLYKLSISDLFKDL